ncbi:helix-turn-helix protein [Krasilnikovia cinnamomea]|uniref:Helix-turn-helix protein n=1 Tax=Krasilnikovia cinnamomea TaxID=349313 RepID=A0A4V2G5Y4_9ACTN|nr:helix-turn-helix transcriptional regulator [Krasilnikovia cinnamomea]RZU46576.1 helix-turn-helix protein [Krasilnikovia cinnamomea]
MAQPTAGPTVVRRQLGRRLRRLRQIAGDPSIDEVVAHRHLGLSRSKLYKLERGQHPAKPQDVAMLCMFYGAAPDEANALTALALATGTHSWWHVFGDDAVPAWFSLYVELEPAAASIRTYEAELIPGLLQTREYAEAVYRAMNPDDGDDIERRVQLRLQRQAILDRADPPRLHAVLSEGAIRRAVGGTEVMTTQLDKLRAMNDRPTITIDVLPFSAGAHASMETTFVLLDFPDATEDPPVVYLETPISAAYLQKPEDVNHFATLFKNTQARAVPLQEFQP